MCKGLEVGGWWGRNRREQRGMRALLSPMCTPARAHSRPRPHPPAHTQVHTPQMHMHTLVSTAGCTSMDLPAERPRRLRHVHRYHTHTHTHTHTHGPDSTRAPSACAHSALWWPALAWRLDVSWSLRSPGHFRDLVCSPSPSPCFLPPVPPQQPEDLPEHGRPSSNPAEVTQRRTSPGSPQSSDSQPQLSSLNLSLQRLFPQLGMPFPAFST